MNSIFIPFIQTNLKFGKYFKYTIDAPSVSSGYPPENAIDYSLDNSKRYSATVKTGPPYYWSICFSKPVLIGNYTFTEPDYDIGSNNAHQKSWIFYGSYSNNSWKAIDSKYNMDKHNSKSYVGNYEVNNSGPFKCFKILSVASYFPEPTLTFRRFEIYSKIFFFPDIITNDIGKKLYFQINFVTLFILF